MERWLEISEQYIAGLNQESLNSSNDGQTTENGVPLKNSDSDFESASSNVNVTETNGKPSDRNIHWEKSLVNLESTADQPEFPLLPASRGFCLTLRKTLAAFQNILGTHNS